MKPSELKHKLRGVMAFAPTPFTTDDRLDADGLAQQVDYLCRSGAHVIVVCGGVGEFFSLDMDEYRTCLRVAAEAAQKRVPVIAGIGHSTRAACQLAAHAASVGIDGLMVHPFYFAKPADEGFAAHYRALAQASGLGLIIYHTHEAPYTLSQVERVAEVEGVVALKDEHGDMKQFLDMRAKLGERFCWINGMAEPMLAPYLAAGAQAMTTGIVNFAPALSLKVWECGSEGQAAALNDLLLNKIRPLAQMRAKRPGYAIAVVKEAMNLLGLSGGCVRSPLLPMRTEDKEELRKLLVKLALLN